MGLRPLIAGLLIAVLPIGLAYLFERVVRRNLYRTGPHEPGLPEATGVPFEAVRFWTADGLELEGWLFHGGDARATVLFMHGTNYNASDMWATEERAALFGGFVRELGCRFFVFDYRGYGANDGVADEQGTYLDAEAALSYLHNRRDIDPAGIVFYGFSLGTGVASELALRERSAGLVLRAPYTSIRELVLERYPRLRVPLGLAPWLPMTRYDSASKIGRIDVPVLIMHSDADATVPYWMGQRLFELANEPKRFVTFDGLRHDEFPLDVMGPAVRAFLQEHVPSLETSPR
jgi:fermentation-respiration switch protein FrsA (DUF1100 family)